MQLHFQFTKFGRAPPSPDLGHACGRHLQDGQDAPRKSFSDSPHTKKAIDVLVASRGQCLAATDSHFGYCLGMRLGEPRLKRWFSPPLLPRVLRRSKEASFKLTARIKTPYMGPASGTANSTWSFLCSDAASGLPCMNRYMTVVLGSFKRVLIFTLKAPR